MPRGRTHRSRCLKPRRRIYFDLVRFKSTARPARRLCWRTFRWPPYIPRALEAGDAVQVRQLDADRSVALDLALAVFDVGGAFQQPAVPLETVDQVACRGGMRTAQLLQRRSCRVPADQPVAVECGTPDSIAPWKE